MPLLHRYQQVIAWIEHHSPGADKFDHSYFGMAIWLASATLLRVTLRSPLPLTILAVLELVNETIDRLTLGRWAWSDTLGDAAATLFWPVLLCLLLRMRTIKG